MIRFPRLSTPIILAVTLGAGFILWQSFRIKHTPASEAGLVLPRLSAQAAQGKIAFDGNCATCHGVNAAGTGNGPPLVHNIYNPGHHADEAFYRAAAYGVRQHHWPFGNMPPQSQMTRQQMDDIILYVREMQLANGITTQPHSM
ncbi:c-type cytochrome [Ferrovibrio xuzhouensis]|uniref:C-type cytochrome n=1 Tax=Ferrovibrio xuzhouensis TaxID=1576914 RepID=A0ABV7VBV0_9PROT